ncbi:MAG TPA: ABC transporter substrate-binding protein [Burkholderiales bacterium]|jgi:putative ABC transport system substrate-binding protein|nr:ABC transporter substrate-binding protein [Burkholderiales bacterium]
MKRREALLSIAGFSLALAGNALGQRGRIPVVGLLDGGQRMDWWAAFKKQLAAFGHVEGKTVAFEARYAKGRLGELPAMAKDLVQRNVTVIVTASSAATQAATQATDRIPIVTGSGSEHVSMGWAVSLAHPGGNVTGVSSLSADLTTKRLELLRETLPGISRLAVLWQLANSGSMAAVRDLEHATQGSRVALLNVGVRKGSELPGAFATAVRERTQAVFVIGGPLVHDERKQIVALAARHKIPAMYTGAEYVNLGGLASYGPDYPDLFRRAAAYVDKILKGAKPGELPIEQATKLEMAINRKTAKALGIEIPQAVLIRADRVID